ncbi:MAG TPA: OsmC family protein [Bacteroidota bacterium]|nr:OsmC family protein [Bacteroidota bacterium]
MVPQNTLYIGELRCKVAHGPSKVELVTDAPTDNHGRGESFSPTDLVVTALSTCMITTAGIAAVRDRVSLNGTKIYAEKHMTAEPPRRIAKVVVRFDISPGVPKDYRPKFEHTCRTCPVALSIHPDIQVDLKFQYPD